MEVSCHICGKQYDCDLHDEQGLCPDCKLKRKMVDNLANQSQGFYNDSAWMDLELDLSPFVGLMAMVHELIVILSEKNLISEPEAVAVVNVGTMAMMNVSNYLIKAIKTNPNLMMTLRDVMGTEAFESFKDYLEEKVRFGRVSSPEGSC